MGGNNLLGGERGGRGTYNVVMKKLEEKLI
jgi:hypothetical protein